MQYDHALIERLVTEFIAGYMSFFSGDYFVETYRDSKTRVEVIRQVTRAAFTNAYASARGYKELARAYLVGQTGLLRRLTDTDKLIDVLDYE